MTVEPSIVDLAKYEAAAEAHYAAIYDTPRHGVKDHYEDALTNLARAIEVAERLGRAEDVARLKIRHEHIRKVYDSQFRGV
jgi:hypothetical protein